VHLALLLLLGSVALEAARLGTVPFSPALKTFGTSVSQGMHASFIAISCANPRQLGQLTHDEVSLYEYTVKGSAGAVVNHWWFTGAPQINNVLVRFYVDGEATASIAVPLDLAAGIGLHFLFIFLSHLKGSLSNRNLTRDSLGFEDADAPWGTAHIGKV